MTMNYSIALLARRATFLTQRACIHSSAAFQGKQMKHIDASQLADIAVTIKQIGVIEHLPCQGKTCALTLWSCSGPVCCSVVMLLRPGVALSNPCWSAPCSCWIPAE